MSLKRLSEEEKTMLQNVEDLRQKMMCDLGVAAINELSLMQIEMITNLIVAEIPGYSEYCRKRLEAFVIRREQSSN